jgi:hypothetical protein
MYGILAATLLVSSTCSTLLETQASSLALLSCDVFPNPPSECLASSLLSSSRSDESSFDSLLALKYACTSNVMTGGNIVRD